MMTIRRAGFTVGILTIALLVAACGGATATAVPTADEGAPTAAPTTTTATGAPNPTEIALPSFDLSGLVANLDGVDSYRLVVTSDGEVQYESKVVTKPVLARDITLDDGTRFVVIGDEAWMGTGDELEPAPPGMATSMLAAFDPMLMFGAFATPGAMAGATDLGSEEKNGVQAHHYRLDSTSVAGAAAGMPAGSSFDVWVSTDPAFLVSMAIVSTDEAFSFDIFDVNDPSIRVERPS